MFLQWLATPFGQDLRALTMACDDLRSLWTSSSLSGGRRKFLPLGYPIASRRKSTQVVFSIACFDSNVCAGLHGNSSFFVACNSVASICEIGYPSLIFLQVGTFKICVDLRSALARAQDSSISSRVTKILYSVI